ncbi:phosphatidate cytidyltransferase [Klebsormidium nitens]|uniref:phytol kinase n=1 Tax=Klebsormidium nitens TaxID=105231 RepID=A0A1Y1HP33_KLENI|nr:phosphatidate cytidyltransferase [Klebsormidium nitens]|eukprot:GAQ80394.1 phosphatidate cytidyltransferase [Klebsormidium nitens]
MHISRNFEKTFLRLLSPANLTYDTMGPKVSWGASASACEQRADVVDSPLSPYFTSSTGVDITAASIALFICVAWLKSVDAAVYFNLLDMRLSRKMIHIGTGPIFLLTWNLFSDAPEARYFAAVVPLLVTAQFFLIGVGVINDPQAVASMSRRGDPSELLRGPLYYGIVFVVSTVVFWRSSPLGVLALSVLCGGDGLAEVLGRKYGRVKLPWSRSKSYVGTAAMFLGSFLFGFGYLVYFNYLKNFNPELSVGSTALIVLLLSLAAAAVEALPFQDVDNITVPLAVIILGNWLLPFGTVNCEY